MPYVFNSPIKIDSVDFSRATPAGGLSPYANNNPRFGPWLYGDYIYVVFSSNTDGIPGNGTLRVFRRHKNGSVWERQNSAGEPNWELSNYTPLATFNPVTGIIHIFIAGEFLSTGSHLFYIQFNCNTNLYGSVSVDNSFGMNPYNRDVFHFFDDTSGVVYAESIGIWWQLYESGSWASIQSLVTLTPFASNIGILSGIVDSSTDILHLFYFIYTSSSPSSGGVYYTQITRSGVASSPILVYDLSAPGLPAYISSSFSVFWNNQVVIAITNYDNSTVQKVIRVNISDSSFVVEDFDSNNHIGDVSSFYLNVYVDSNNILWVTWEVYIFGDGSAIDDQLWTNSNNGSGWGTATLVYDARLNPPPNGEPEDGSQFVHTIGVIQLPNGCWSYVTALETFEADFIHHCTGFELLTCSGLLGGGWKLYEA